MKISVVCAPQTFGCNAGMFSVDLAAWGFLKKHFPEANIDFLTLYPHKCDFGRLPFNFSLEDGQIERFYESDVILYWGDFLHALPYRNAVISQLQVQGKCSSVDQALARVRKFLFLAEHEELREKAVLYGGTLLFNQADSYSDAVYASDLKNLVQSAKRVWMREPFSASIVNRLQGLEQRSAHGTDCAQLLNPSTLEHCVVKGSYARDAKQKKIGVFIGRSHFDMAKTSSLIAAIQAQLQMQLSWLDWGREPFFYNKKDETLGYLPQMRVSDSDIVDPPVEVLAALTGLDLLISDTYHACVNAWSFGIPAICLIDNCNEPVAVNSGSGLCGRDKRVVFYWAYNAAPFLIFSSELSDDIKIQKKAEQVSLMLNDQVTVNGIKRQMSEHVDLSEQLLVQTLQIQ